MLVILFALSSLFISVQSNCNLGTYEKVPPPCAGCTQCITCDTNTYGTGVNTCTPCPSGTDTRGQWGCMTEDECLAKPACSKGQSYGYTYTCEDCRKDTYTDTTDATYCSYCPYGKTTNNSTGQSVCVDIFVTDDGNGDDGGNDNVSGDDNNSGNDSDGTAKNKSKVALGVTISMIGVVIAGGFAYIMWLHYKKKEDANIVNKLAGESQMEMGNVGASTSPNTQENPLHSPKSLDLPPLSKSALQQAHAKSDIDETERNENKKEKKDHIPPKSIEI